MSDIAEMEVAVTVEAPVVGQIAVRVQPQPLAAAKKNFRFPVRRSQRVQTKAEIEANRIMIADFIAKKGVTVCPPGYANGSVPTQYDFV